ncbi:hypothetical protein [Paraburkholderia diazotrophica]|uniref:hypothetical protein n=1 Tax=Paraburkholderia diazotrophica TaxID=667676 RepID=UPI003170640A
MYRKTRGAPGLAPRKHGRVPLLTVKTARSVDFDCLRGSAQLRSLPGPSILAAKTYA